MPKDNWSVEGEMELVDDPTIDLVLKTKNNEYLSCGGLFHVGRWAGKRVRITIEEIE
jgi:hypothetical protein